MTVMPRITIRFIRSGEDNALNDDKVTIQRVNQTHYDLEYTYGALETKRTHNVTLPDQAVFRWMRHTIALLEKDEDPFDLVQMDLPFMPSVLYDASRMGDVYHRMLDALEFHLDNWPSLPCPNPEEEEEENARFYDDMPALVRNSDHTFHWNYTQPTNVLDEEDGIDDSIY